MRVVICGGAPYMVDELEDNRGVYMWCATKPLSEVYHVGAHGCTCPARKPCKHMEAMAPTSATQPPVKQLERTDRRHTRG